MSGYRRWTLEREWKRGGDEKMPQARQSSREQHHVYLYLFMLGFRAFAVHESMYWIYARLGFARHSFTQGIVRVQSACTVAP